MRGDALMRVLLVARVSALALLLLGGCQAWDYEGNENSPLYQVPVGARLTLSRDIAIPAGQVSVFIQGGRVRPFAEIDKYYPHCRFELYRLQNVGRTVRPDEFEVRRVQRQEDDLVSLEGIR